MNFLAGITCVVGGILVVETWGHDWAVANIIAAGLILYGVYRLVMMLLDVGEV